MFRSNGTGRPRRRTLVAARPLVDDEDSLHRTGEWLDGLGYALLADEWGAQR